jgi:hypothetical protein
MRAANGVVLITTKRGRSGKARVTFDAYYGVQQFPKKLDLLNSQQLIDLAQEAVDNLNAQMVTPGDDDYRQLHVDVRPGSTSGLTNIIPTGRMPLSTKMLLWLIIMLVYPVVLKTQIIFSPLDTSIRKRYNTMGFNPIYCPC